MARLDGAKVDNSCGDPRNCESLRIKRTKQEWLQQYEVSIRFLSTGCIVQVGCKQIPFTSVSYAMSELDKYVRNPEEIIKIWESKFEE